MKVWLPYVVGGSGTDTFTQTFAEFIQRAGHTAVVQAFPHAMQYVPDALRFVSAPTSTDIVLTNSWNGFSFKRKGMPMLTVEHLFVHDSEYTAFRSNAQAAFHRTLVHSYEKRSFEAADRVVAVSRSTRRAVMKSFPGVDPTVILNGVDTDFFTPPSRPRERSEGGPFNLLFVGNLTARKGADLLEPVMRQLGPNYLLSYPSGIRMRGNLDIKNGRPLGSLDRRGVLEAYREADAFLFPTRLEGLPLAVLEAMSTGLPIVGSDRTSMPEVVEDGVTGILCPLEPTELAAAVETLALDAALREEMSKAARQAAVEAFSMTLTVERYVALFSDLIDSGPR